MPVWGRRRLSRLRRARAVARRRLRPSALRVVGCRSCILRGWRGRRCRDVVRAPLVEGTRGGAGVVMSLTMAAAITLAASCQQAVAPQTIVRIAVVESHLEPFALHDNSDGRSYAPATRPEAFRLATALIAAGHRLDVGLTQINTANFPWLRLSLATALDPCTNIAAS